jgi:hypothetical protein
MGSITPVPTSEEFTAPHSVLASRHSTQALVTCLPDTTQQLFDDMAFYASAAAVWSSLLTSLDAPKDGLCAELGCGVVPKVAMGLHYYRHVGQVDLIEPSARALASAETWLNFLCVQFAHTPIRESLFDLRMRRYDSVCANHALDDIILQEHCLRSGLPYEDLYCDASAFCRTWDTITRDCPWLSAFLDHLARTLTSLLSPGGLLILCDYQSHSHRALQLTSVTSLQKAAQQHLRSSLISEGLLSCEEKIPQKIQSGRFVVESSDIIALRSPL